MVILDNGKSISEDEIVYIEKKPETENQNFNEELWNYERKGEDKPTLYSILAKNLKINENVYDIDGNLIGKRVE